MDNVIDSVKEYYGKVLKDSSDLKTNACCTRQSMPLHVTQALKQINENVINRYYGCGLCIPECLEGVDALDLGCGSGRDVYLLSQLVGPSGHVTGVDMTQEQLDVACSHEEEHRIRFDYPSVNTRFLLGKMEALGEAGVKPESFDIVVSNCVVNLSLDKKAVLKETFNILKNGGELYFSDVYSDQEVPESLRNNRELWNECLSGALYWPQLHSLAQEIGFARPRLVSASPIAITEPDLLKVVGPIRFVSATYRLFKLPSDEQLCSIDRNVVKVIYEGGIPYHKEVLHFDHTISFQREAVVEVDPELAQILRLSRFSQYFTVQPTPKSLSVSLQDSNNLPQDPFALSDKVKDGDNSAQSCCPSQSKKTCC